MILKNKTSKQVKLKNQNIQKKKGNRLLCDIKQANSDEKVAVS